MVTNSLPPGLRVSGQRHHHLLYRSKDAQTDICSGRGRAHVSYDFGGKHVGKVGDSACSGYPYRMTSMDQRALEGRGCAMLRG